MPGTAGTQDPTALVNSLLDHARIAAGQVRVERGSVTVGVRCARGAEAKEAIRLVIAVADTGAGIAPDKVDSVSEPFVRGDACIARAHGGTGLGLAIARQLTRLLGESLRVESRLGEGSTFTLEVPVPIFAMTGNSAEDYGEACTAAGMDGCVMKSVRLEQLRGLPGRLCGTP